MLRIKTLRMENNLSQRSLALKIGSSQKSVDYWEKGVSEPTAGFLIALANCFGCSVDYLLGREDDFGNVNLDCDLTEAEKTLLKSFRGLSKQKREELLRFSDFLGQYEK